MEACENEGLQAWQARQQPPTVRVRHPIPRHGEWLPVGSPTILADEVHRLHSMLELGVRIQKIKQSGREKVINLHAAEEMAPSAREQDGRRERAGRQCWNVIAQLVHNQLENVRSKDRVSLVAVHDASAGVQVVADGEEVGGARLSPSALGRSWVEHSGKSTGPHC
jgi:hypothetical protein